MVASYKQFCPVAMAAEVLETRWTLLIVRGLCLGSKHFNELRRGVPRCRRRCYQKDYANLKPRNTNHHTKSR